MKTKVEYPTSRKIMGEAIERLRGEQRKVYFLTIREGRSLMETAEVLGISKRTAQRYCARAVRFIARYCQNAMIKGRI